jgi:SulP family sulfate permease
MTIEGLARKSARNGVTLVITGASAQVRHDLITHGVKPPTVVYRRSIDDAFNDPSVRVGVSEG